MKVICDTSFRVALFLESDVNHTKAITLAKEIKITEQILLLNPFIIEETSTILTYKGSKKMAHDFLKSLQELSTVNTGTSIEEYIAYFHVIKEKISFADTSILFDAIKYQCTLVSFDKQQNTIRKKMW